MTATSDAWKSVSARTAPKAPAACGSIRRPRWSPRGRAVPSTPRPGPGTCPARGLGGDAVLLVAAGVVQGDGDAVATRPAHRPVHGARPADDLLTSLLRDSARDDDVCLPLCHREVARASDGGHRVRRSRGGSDDGKAAVRGVQDRQELRQL